MGLQASYGNGHRATAMEEAYPSSGSHSEPVSAQNVEVARNCDDEGSLAGTGSDPSYVLDCRAEVGKVYNNPLHWDPQRRGAAQARS